MIKNWPNSPTGRDMGLKIPKVWVRIPFRLPTKRGNNESEKGKKNQEKSIRGLQPQIQEVLQR